MESEQKKNQQTVMYSHLLVGLMLKQYKILDLMVDNWRFHRIYITYEKSILAPVVSTLLGVLKCCLAADSLKQGLR